MRWACYAVVLLLPAACGFPSLPQIVPVADAPFQIPSTDAAPLFDAATDAMVDALLVDAVPSVCGDGRVDPSRGETCDDGNTNACGTCPATDCKASPITATKAHCTVQAADASFGHIFSGSSFTLDDGFGQVITFEFVKEGDVLSDPNHIPISFRQAPEPDGAATVAANMVIAITGQFGFGITAAVQTDQASNVILTSRRKSAVANTAISFVGLAGFVFGTANKLEGGLAGDCGATIGCVSGDDCASGVCSSGKCQACTLNNQCPASTTCNVATGKCH